MPENPTPKPKKPKPTREYAVQIQEARPGGMETMRKAWCASFAVEIAGQYRRLGYMARVVVRPVPVPGEAPGPWERWVPKHPRRRRRKPRRPEA